LSGFAAKIGKRDVGLVPVLKRQLALDAAVMSWRNHGQGVSLIVPGILLADLDLCGGWQTGGIAGERDRIFVLGIGEPGARAIIHGDMPLVPAALGVLIENAADGHEVFIAIYAFRMELDRRTVRREVGHLADFLEIDVRAHENAFAILTNRLNAAGPLEDNLCAAIGTVRDGLSHGPLLTCCTKQYSL